MAAVVHVAPVAAMAGTHAPLWRTMLGIFACGAGDPCVQPHGSLKGAHSSAAANGAGRTTTSGQSLPSTTSVAAGPAAASATPGTTPPHTCPHTPSYTPPHTPRAVALRDATVQAGAPSCRTSCEVGVQTDMGPPLASLHASASLPALQHQPQLKQQPQQPQSQSTHAPSSSTAGTTTTTATATPHAWRGMTPNSGSVAASQQSGRPSTSGFLLRPQNSCGLQALPGTCALVVQFLDQQRSCSVCFSACCDPLHEPGNVFGRYLSQWLMDHVTCRTANLIYFRAQCTTCFCTPHPKHLTPSYDRRC